MQINQQLVQNFKKYFQEVRNCRLLIEIRKRHNAEPSQCITKFTIDDRQFYNDFQPIASIMTEKFYNT